MKKQHLDGLSAGTILRGKSYNYRIVEVLGQGSFGITYLAAIEDENMKKLGSDVRVTIKEFFMEKINGREQSIVTIGTQQGLYSEYKEKFLREANNLAKMNHPHIVRVLETFEANNTVYYSMEYLDGGSLDKYIAGKSNLPENEVVAFSKEIGGALYYMHQHKMLHLDLKPANVMLRSNGEVVLIDFGLSKQYNEDGEPESSTKVGGGTPGYAPIEQASYHEGKDFPVTMDVYALGGTMFKMLTGHRPPEASEILNDGFPVAELIGNDVSQQMIDIVKKAMSPLKKNRYQSVEDMVKVMPVVDDVKLEGGQVIDQSKAGIISIHETTTLIEFSFIDNSASPKEYKRYDVKITPQMLYVKTETTDAECKEQSFFFSETLFADTIHSINKLQLQAVNRQNSYTLNDYLVVTLKAYKGDKLAVNASSDGNAKWLLTGNIDGLKNIVDKTAKINYQRLKKKTETGSLLELLMLVAGVLVTLCIALTLGKKTSTATYVSPDCPDEKHPHFRDLGLPSGTKWACQNIADSVDIEDAIDLESDDYRLPTIQEFEELEEYCSKKEDKDQFNLGTWYTGPNGARIYFHEAWLDTGIRMSIGENGLIKNTNTGTGTTLVQYRYWALNEEDLTSLYYWGAESHSSMAQHTTCKYCIRPVAK